MKKILLMASYVIILAGITSYKPAVKTVEVLCFENKDKGRFIRFSKNADLTVNGTLKHESGTINFVGMYDDIGMIIAYKDDAIGDWVAEEWGYRLEEGYIFDPYNNEYQTATCK